MMNRKHARLVPGELIEIPLPSGRFGYCRVLRNDRFGVLVAVLSGVANQQMGEEVPDCSGAEVREVAYVNKSSARKWSHVDAPLAALDEITIPHMFYGSSLVYWTVVAPDGTTVVERIPGGQATAQKLRERGLMHMVLWHGSKIELLIDEDRPLIWPSFLK